MNQTKKTTIIPLLLSILVISGCGKVMKTESGVGGEEFDNNEEVSIDTSDIEPENIVHEKIDYSGKLTKEEDGWKKYRNEYWGIEFRFRDEEDIVDVFGDSTSILLGHKQNVQENRYLRINFFDNDYNCKGKNGSLLEYLQAGCWNESMGIEELRSLNVIKRDNFEIYETEVYVRYTPPPSSVAKEYITKRYYIDHECMDKKISIHFSKLESIEKYSDIINTFNLIK